MTIVISIIFSIFLIICTSFLWWYLTIRKFKSLEKIPGPTPLPIVGNAHQLGTSPQGVFDNFNLFHKLHGGIYKLFIGSKIKVIFAKPHLMEYILSSQVHINKSNQYDLTKPFVGEGLITSGGAKWRSRRKMITPTFHFKILEQFSEVFNVESQVLIEVLSTNTDQIIDIVPFMNKYTLDVICSNTLVSETAMGVNTRTGKNEIEGYSNALKALLHVIMMRFFSFWQRSDLLFRLFASSHKHYEECLTILHEFTDKVIRKRREEFRQRQSKISIQDQVGQKSKVALLDLLLESENSNMLSDEDLREEISTFMFAGHDTTKTAISFTLLTMAQNPDVQERVYQEVMATTGPGVESPITMSQIQDLKYLEMVIKETQRLYPVAPFIERKLEEGSYIDGLKYPAGTEIFLFIYGLHHSEESFPDPEKFDPDRFLPENTVRRHPYAYVPFSAGPRNCIGQKFAMLEMKITIAHIVQKFKLLPVPNFRPELGIAGILTSFNGIQLQLKHR